MKDNLTTNVPDEDESPAFLVGAVSGSLHSQDFQYLEGELKRRQEIIQSEPDGFVRETMIENLLDGLFTPSKVSIELGFEYEIFFKSTENDFVKIDGWYPIATDRIVRPEKIDHYIETGLLRRNKLNSKRVIVDKSKVIVKEPILIYEHKSK